jgi:hypothetical protein
MGGKMADDLVKRLREGADYEYDSVVMDIAADRIEQLEAALRPFVEPCIKHCYETCESEEERMEDCMCFKARAALEGKDD